jgi:hypothetical protein
MNPNPGPRPIPCHLLAFVGVAVAVRIVRAVERRISHDQPFLVPTK